MPPKDITWKLDPHTKAKHIILKRYLDAWFPILANARKGGLLYIDGFCGPGSYKDGEDGSPLIALKSAVQQQTWLNERVLFWFLDGRLDRVEHLRKKIAEISLPANFEVISDHGEFDKKLPEVLRQFDDSRCATFPTFAFVDPFGFKGIPFSLIADLLKRPQCEVLINFMVEPINRWIEHPNEAVVDHIRDAFGTDDCVKVARESSDPFIDLRDLYTEQLMTVAKFVRHFEMRNKQNKPLYFLFFASNNAKGHLKMKEAMWAVDPHGEFMFSDSTKPRQLVCYGDSVKNIADLRHIVRENFAGDDYIPVHKIAQFVEDETAYLSKHMREAFKDEEKSGGAIVADKRIDDKPRRANSFPNEALIRILQEPNPPADDSIPTVQLSLFGDNSSQS